ncbi:MAG: von Willebrand factor type A domain-containing protein [Kiritimatiellales bacterium]|nr:von Willebrand factor type A domain-containing protein [Kiritimatiellales bacterium]
MKFERNDPKLTAYALGELPEAERTAFEKELETNPEARQAVEEIRKLAGKIKDHYAAEAQMVLTEEQHETIRQAARKNRKEKIIPFPRKPWIPIAVAASIGGILLMLSGSIVIFSTVEKREVAFCPPSPVFSRQKTDLQKPRVKMKKNAVAGSTQRIISRTQQSLPEIEVFGSAGIAQGFVAENVGSGVMLGDAEGLVANQWGPSIEDYAEIQENKFLRVADQPLSTFSIDVDTASYANVRRFLNEGRLPPKDAVRIEEMINYFDYNYAPPRGNVPFATHMELSRCPWNEEHKLVRIGLKGRVIEQAARPPLNLVFLLDVSGSMNQENKLPLVQRAMTMLAQQLDKRDHVAIVVYAGSSGLVLPPTSGANSRTIIAALKRLKAGGGTNGGQGIQLAYSTALENFNKDGVNRVILCTDGDFNIGVTQGGDLNRLIEEKAKSGIFLSVLGFGTGNTKDSTMEQLADRGNGNYAYIDTFNEARKVLVDQMSGTLVTIAKDVKIQVEFNPARVAGYRLIGYENRMLATEDFNDDKKDAGEIGAGHTVTALYEIIPAGQPVNNTPDIDDLKYQPTASDALAGNSGELLTVKLRYKEPDGDISAKLEFPLMDTARSFSETSPDFRFATAVAGFGMLLRDSDYKGTLTCEQVLEWAARSQGNDEFGYRREFIDLVRKAGTLLTPTPAQEPDVPVYEHIVYPGETIWDIARQYGCTEAEIIRLNKITDTRQIKQGTKLLVPIPE